jgi:hypothetical protein
MKITSIKPSGFISMVVTAPYGVTLLGVSRQRFRA